MTHAEEDLYHWFVKSKSLLIGQDTLLENFILNFIKSRENTPGFHGIVLDGASGSGKTFLGSVLQKTCPFEAVYKDCIEIFINSKIGGSENELEKVLLSSNNRRLIVLDNSESIFSSNRQENDLEPTDGFSDDPVSLERKIFLFSKFLIDKINRESKAPVFLVAIVPDKNGLPPEIRFPGRLNYHFNVNTSKSIQREQVLRNFLKNWPFESEKSKENCVKVLSGQPTSGFTLADLESFIQRTWELKIIKDNFVLDDFLKARHFVNPSSIVARVSKIISSSNNSPIFVGLEEQFETIQRYLSAIFILDDPSIPLPRGILLEGPSGCGKSLLASKLSKFQIENASFPINCIAVDSTQIISKYFGQSDRNLSQIFAEARQAAPCILFFDQIDTLVGTRGKSGGESDSRLVTTFLVEMDGLKSKLTDSSNTVIVLGTTSKKDLIDPAILRPGRLDLHVNIPIPNESARLKFIETFMSRAPGKYHLNSDEIKRILLKSEGSSFAELDSTFKEAAMNALRENLDCSGVDFKHFDF